MRWLSLVAVASTFGCSVDLDYTRTTIAFDPVSPQAPGGGGDPITANGKLIFTSTIAGGADSGFISRDDGATWNGSNPAISVQYGHAWSENELIVNTTQFGYGRWNMTTDQVVSIDTPISPVGAMTVTSDGTIIMNQAASATIARQTANGVWSQVTLPQPPTPPGGFPNVYDVVATSSGVFLIADWGVYRSGDNGASWGFVYDPNIVAYMMALPDGRVALLNQNRTQIVDVLDANGMGLGIVSPPFPGSSQNRPAISCLGALVYGDQYSTDLGMTWTPIMPVIPNVTWQVGRVGCGGSYLAVHVLMPSDWLLKMPAFGQLGSLYNYPRVGGMLGGGMIKLKSGTVLSSDLAWTPGDAAWDIRLLPRGFDIVALADGSLWGHAGRNVVRSTDDGVTFTTTMATADLPAFLGPVFAELGGTLWASAAGAGVDGYPLWRSDDHGVTWQQVGMAGPLAAVANDGTLITAGGASFSVSHDKGQSWTAAPFPPGFDFRWVTSYNHGVTYDQNDTSDDRENPDTKTDGAPSFHLWDDYGAGYAYEQRTPLVPTVDAGDQPADLYPVLSSIAIDPESYVWWFGGSGAQAVWKSREPLDSLRLPLGE